MANAVFTPLGKITRTLRGGSGLQAITYSFSGAAGTADDDVFILDYLPFPMIVNQAQVCMTDVEAGIKANLGYGTYVVATDTYAVTDEDFFAVDILLDSTVNTTAVYFPPVATRGFPSPGGYVDSAVNTKANVLALQMNGNPGAAFAGTITLLVTLIP